MNEHGEHFGAFAFEADEVVGHDQVAGGRNRQELGEAFDDAQQDRDPEQAHSLRAMIAGTSVSAVNRQVIDPNSATIPKLRSAG